MSKSLKASLQFRQAGRSARALAARLDHQPRGSMTALLRRAGPFVPERDAFAFRNTGWPILESDAAQLRERYRAAVDGASLGILQAVRLALGKFTLPALVLDAVVGSLTRPVRDELFDAIISGTPGAYGRCGGMALAAYDMFQAGVPVDRFGAQKPAPETPLYRYIWTRLLESLEPNLLTFLAWGFELHLLPKLSPVASTALGAAIGSIGGPLGGALGALVAGGSDALSLGGPDLFGARARDHIARLQEDLRREAAWPIGLIFKDKPSPVDAHQVLATHVQVIGDHVYRISVWDNVHGPKTDTIQLDCSGDRIVAVGTYEALGAILREDYSPAPIPDDVRRDAFRTA